MAYSRKRLAVALAHNSERNTIRAFHVSRYFAVGGKTFNFWAGCPASR